MGLSGSKDGQKVSRAREQRRDRQALGEGVLFVFRTVNAS